MVPVCERYPRTWYPRWLSIAVPLAAIACRSPWRVRLRPPRSEATAASRARSRSCAVIPSSARREAADPTTRGAISSSIQPMSSAAVTCRVPRIGQDLTISPASNAAPTSSSVSPCPRRPIDHRAPGRSCPCIASMARTTLAGVERSLVVMRWAAWRNAVRRRRSVVNPEECMPQYRASGSDDRYGGCRRGGRRSWTDRGSTGRTQDRVRRPGTALTPLTLLPVLSASIRRRARAPAVQRGARPSRALRWPIRTALGCASAVGPARRTCRSPCASAARCRAARPARRAPCSADG